jgi:DNA invertase Pin-like site-specific DNA recombinase
VAQTERSFNHQRQAEGIAAAKAKGVKFGRPVKERSELFYSLHELWKHGGISAREAARRIGISHTAFLNWVEEKTLL